jgi:hypothetical protein
MLEGTLPRRQGIAALVRLIGVQCGEPATASAWMSFVMCGDLRSNTISAAAWLYMLLLSSDVWARGDVVVEFPGART